MSIKGTGQLLAAGWIRKPRLEGVSATSMEGTKGTVEGVYIHRQFPILLTIRAFDTMLKKNGYVESHIYCAGPWRNGEIAEGHFVINWGEFEGSTKKEALQKLEMLIMKLPVEQYYEDQFFSKR